MSFLAETFFMESVDSDVIELDIIAEQANIDFMKIDQMYAMVEAQKNINLAASELKVVTESGTVEDLEMLYEAATAEANAKKEGIIAKAITSVKNFFGKILNFINEKILKKKPAADETVVVSRSFLDSLTQLSKDQAGLDGDAAKLKGGQKITPKKIAIIGGLTAAGVAAGAVAIKKTDLMKKIDPVSRAAEKSIKSVEKIEETVNNASAVIVDPDAAKDLLTEYNNQAKNANTIIKYATAKLNETKEQMQNILDDVLNQPLSAHEIDNAGAIADQMNALDKKTKKSITNTLNASLKKERDKRKFQNNVKATSKGAQQSFEDVASREDALYNTASAHDNLEDIFGADYTYESAMSELELMIDAL